jgi:Flp pilus assembly protein TadG
VTTRRVRFRERGQALVETALVAPFLLVLLLGIIEFGRAWMVSNMITHEARHWARIAATASNRDSTGAIDASSIAANAHADIQAATGLDLPVTAQQTQINGIWMVQVHVTGNVAYLFGVIPGVTGFSADRTVTFRDEGRS